jgi:hypothetical protein
VPLLAFTPWVAALALVGAVAARCSAAGCSRCWWAPARWR